jgi:hypothetical protein
MIAKNRDLESDLNPSTSGCSETRPPTDQGSTSARFLGWQIHPGPLYCVSFGQGHFSEPPKEHTMATSTINPTPAIEGSSATQDENIRVENEATALRHRTDAAVGIAEAQAAAANESIERLISGLPESTAWSQLQAASSKALPLLGISALLFVGSSLLSYFSLAILPVEALRIPVALCLVLGTMGAIDVTLETRKTEDRLLFSAVASASLVFLVVHWLLAKARVAMIVAGIQTTSVVTFAGDETGGSTVDDVLSKALLPILAACLPVLALASEIALGCLYHFAMSAIFQPGMVRWRCIQRLRRVRVAYLTEAIRQRAIAKDCGAVVRESRARTAARWQILARIIAYAVPLLILLALLFCFGQQLVAAQPTVPTENVVFLIDCSASRPASEIVADRAFVDRSLGLAKPGSRQIAVLIGEDSWGQNSLLLDGTVTTDPGFMERNLRVARQKLQENWRTSVKALKCGYKGTDIAGGLLYVQQLLANGPRPTTSFYLLSDMRNTRTVNFERLDIQQLSSLSPRVLAIPNLQGVSVFIQGVQPSGVTPQYWDTLRSYWIKYFLSAGATIRSYAMTRNMSTVTGPNSFPALKLETQITSSPENISPPSSERRAIIAGAHPDAAAEQSLRIITPSTGSACYEEAVVEGTGAASGSPPWIVVRAVGTYEYWPNHAQIRGVGNWFGSIVCGRHGRDQDVHYQVMALENPEIPLQQGIPVAEWPRAERVSQIIEVIRK